MQTESQITPAERFESDAQKQANESRPDNSTIEAKLTQLVDKLDRLTKHSRRERYRIWVQVELFSKAVHYFSYDTKYGSTEIEVWDDEDQDLYSTVPLTHFVVEMLSAEYAKSKPRVVPHNENEARKQQLMQEDLLYLAECLQHEYWIDNPEMRQLESKLVITRGAVFCQLEWDKSKGKKVQQPNIQMQGDDARSIGQQEMRTGKPLRHIRDPFQVEIFADTIEESPALDFQEIAFRAKIKKLYPHINIEDYQPESGREEGFSGIYFKKELERIVGNMGQLDASKGGYGSLSRTSRFFDELTCLHRQVWLDRWIYEDLEVMNANGTKLPGEETVLPQGTKLGDVYDEGIRLCMVNGKVVKLYNEAKNDVWDGYRYTVPSEGYYGAGVTPIISLNKSYDELASLDLQSALMSSLGILLVDARIDKFDNTPGGNPIIVEDRRNGEELSSMVHHVATPGAGAETKMLKQEYKENLIDISGVRSPNTSGMSGEGMKTATGVNYQQATANGISAPKLELFASHCARIIEKAVKMMKKYGVQPLYFSNFKDSRGKWFDPLDIPDDLTFRVEEDSHQPRTTEDVKNDTFAGLQVGWGSGTLAPEANEQIAKVLRLPEGANDYTDWATKAEKRLDAMKEVDAMLEQAGALEMITQQIAVVMEAQTQMPPQVDEMGQPVPPQPPPDPNTILAQQIIEAAKAAPQPMDNNPMFVRFWMELYVTDEFDEMSEPMKAAITQLWQAHQDAEAMKAAEDMKRQLAAQAPAMEAEQAQAAQAEEAKAASASGDAERSEAHESETQEKEMERSAVEMEHQSYESEAGRQHEKDMADRDDKRMDKEHSHDEAMAKLNKKDKKDG